MKINSLASQFIQWNSEEKKKIEAQEKAKRQEQHEKEKIQQQEKQQ